MRDSKAVNIDLRRVTAGLLFSALATVWTGCTTTTAEKPKPHAPTMEDMPPVPTVPPKSAAPTPLPPHAVEPEDKQKAEPLKVRPIAKPVEAKPGQAIGPIVTYLGAARADGIPVKPASIAKDGVPIYNSAVGSGFILVIEAKPGANNVEVGKRLYAHVEDDPKQRGDLEIVSDKDLGDGSTAVCDRQRPKIGGVPGINPPSFAETQKISDAINDLGCRFETFLDSDFSCTMDEKGSYTFVSKETTTQYCLIVAKAYGFPVGTTELSVRVRDIDGNPGPVKKLRIVRPKETPKPAVKPKPTPPKKVDPLRE